MSTVSEYFGIEGSVIRLLIDAAPFQLIDAAKVNYVTNWLDSSS